MTCTAEVETKERGTHARYCDADGRTARSVDAVMVARSALFLRARTYSSCPVRSKHPERHDVQASLTPCSEDGVGEKIIERMAIQHGFQSIDSSLWRKRL